MGKTLLDKDYAKWIVQLKQKVLHAQLKAAASNNKALIDLYWELGKEITEREKQLGYHCLICKICNSAQLVKRYAGGQY